MKVSDRLRGMADFVRCKGNSCRERDPTLSASLRGYARELAKLADDAAALECALAKAMDIRT
ncbi:MAG: hypothetical protein ACREHF_01980 [Rhizomicrobium sp.]